MEYKFRKGASHGHFCSMLLLSSLYFVTEQSSKYHQGVLYFLLKICSCATLSYKLKDCFNVVSLCWQSFTINLMLTAIFSQFTMHDPSHNAFLICLLYLFAQYYHAYVTRSLLTKCPGSFSCGEAEIISQSTMLFLIWCFCSLWTTVRAEISDFLHGNHPYLHELIMKSNIPTIDNLPESVTCLQVSILGILLLIHLLCAFPFLRQQMYFFIVAGIVSTSMLYAWSKMLRKNIVSWLLSYCFYNRKRIFLISFWLISTLSSVAFVAVVNQKSNKKASTITRKFFHLIISAVYIAGVFYDLDLLRLASAIVFGILITLELFRILKLPFIGQLIQDSLQVFLDEKDSGVLILTHIYLLLGCSSSIWLASHTDTVNEKGYHLSLLSGVISVGIGDTAAAIGGTLFGKHHWKNSKKTYEGSICAFVVQLMSTLYFLSLGHEFSFHNVGIVSIAVLLTTVSEAKTTQVDNLVLPLFMFPMLCWI